MIPDWWIGSCCALVVVVVECKSCTVRPPFFALAESCCCLAPQPDSMTINQLMMTQTVRERVTVSEWRRSVCDRRRPRANFAGEFFSARIFPIFRANAMNEKFEIQVNFDCRFWTLYFVIYVWSTIDNTKMRERLQLVNNMFVHCFVFLSVEHDKTFCHFVGLGLCS